MSEQVGAVQGHVGDQSAVSSRWARFGPYYAMFPMDFAYSVVDKYSKIGDYVLDPFAGRGSSLFASASLGRVAHGIEINPVGWLYSNVKLAPAPLDRLENRLAAMIKQANEQEIDAQDYPVFFSHCFSKRVMAFLVTAKDSLAWRDNNTDAALMAFILHYLHGKRGQSLSNQMPMVKSMSPRYSVDWWAKKDMLTPPQVDIEDFLMKRFRWRYQQDIQSYPNARALLGDSMEELPKLGGSLNGRRYSLLFTSPPYQGVTNYFVDQWLRYWLLGGPDRPETSVEKHKRRFTSVEEYRALLESVFSACSNMMADDAHIYVRTDIREYTHITTRDILKKCFPSHRISETVNECNGVSQTELYGNSNKKPCEIDIVLTP